MFMKKSLAIGMIVLFGLTSCSVNWNNEKDTKISELEKRVQDDLFKKRQECAKYKDEIESDIKNRWDEEFVELFYSPVRHSCLYIANRSFNDACQELHWQTMIYDHLNKYSGGIDWSKICVCSIKEKNNCYDDMRSIDTKIKELK